MGDHRADIKIEFTIHGKCYRMDSYINWFPDENGVDLRVVEFFVRSWEDARERYEAAIAKADELAASASREAAERAELARLKAKYEGAGDVLTSHPDGTITARIDPRKEE